MTRSRRTACAALIALAALIAAFPCAADEASAPGDRAGAPEAAPAEPQAAAAGAAEPAAPVLRGRVTGPKGKPVAGARLAAVEAPDEDEEDSSFIGRIERMFGEGRAGTDGGPEFHEARTDEAGRFELSLPGPGPWNLRAEADGFAPAILQKLRPGGAETAFSLQTGRSVSGKVYDRRRRVPAEGARVVARQKVDRGFSDPADPERFRIVATVDREGSFTLRNLPSGLHDLLVTAQGFALALVEDVAVDTAQREPLLAYLDPGFSVSGRVVDRDGKGVPAAVVAARPEAGSMRFDLDAFRALALIRARTDERGAFRLVGLPREVPVRLTASLPDGAAGRSSLPDPGSRASLGDVEIVVDRPARIVGRLAGPEGGVPPRASLSFVASEEGARAPTARKRIDPLPLGAAGEFEAGGLPAGTGTVTIEAEGFRDHRAEDVRLTAGGTFELGAVTLDPGLRIRGKVTDSSGKPVAGAEVSASATGPGGFGPRRFQRSASEPETKTDSEGRFTIGGLEDRKHTLVAQAPGFSEERLQNVAAGSEEAAIVLKKAGGLTGRVVTGEPPVPVPGFSVRTHSREPEDEFAGVLAMMGGEGKDFNDPSGAFSLRGLSPGAYTIEVVSPGYAATVREDVTVREGETLALGDVVLDAGMTLRGRVVDPAGSPVAGASVRVRPPGLFSLDLNRSGGTLTTLDGRFALKGLRAGSHTVQVRHPDFSHAETPIRLDREVEPEPLVVTLGAGGRISGVARDADGRPQAGVAIMAMVPTDPLSRSPVETDEEGRFLIENLAPGGYTVMRLPAPGGGRMAFGSGMDTKQATVKEGETTVVNFGDERKIRVHGTVRKGATGLAEARVVWMRADAALGAPDFKMATTDDAGRYEVSLSNSGLYSVRVSGEGQAMTMGMSLPEVEVPDAAEFEHDLVLPEGVIAGTVLSDADNSPVEGAWVAAFDADDDEGTARAPGRRGLRGSMGETSGSARTGEDGAYRLEGLGPGTYRLTFSKQGFATETVEGVSLDDSGTVTADAYLRRGRKVVVRVLDPDGRPVPRAMVGLVDAEGRQIPGAGSGGFTGVDGLATIEGVREGLYGVIAMTRDLPLGILRGVEVGRETDGAAELRLPAGGSLTVTVLDAEGKPVGDAAVSLVDPSGVDLDWLMPGLRMMSGLPMTTGKDGAMSFPRLAAGRYAITASTDGGASASGSAEVVEGKTATVTLRLK